MGEYSRVCLTSEPLKPRRPESSKHKRKWNEYTRRHVPAQSTFARSQRLSIESLNFWHSLRNPENWEKNIASEFNYFFFLSLSSFFLFCFKLHQLREIRPAFNLNSLFFRIHQSWLTFHSPPPLMLSCPCVCVYVCIPHFLLINPCIVAWRENVYFPLKFIVSGKFLYDRSSSSSSREMYFYFFVVRAHKCVVVVAVVVANDGGHLSRPSSLSF